MTTTMTSLNDLSKTQLAQAIGFVTGENVKRLSSRAAGLKRLRREIGAKMLTDRDVLAHLNGTAADGHTMTVEPEAAETEAEPVQETAAAEAEAKFRTDKWGFVHRVRRSKAPAVTVPAEAAEAPAEAAPVKARGRRARTATVEPASNGPAEGTKASIVLALVTRPGGATTSEIRAAATPNIRQTCRGLRVSVQGFTFESERLQNGEYRWTGRIA